MPQQRPDIRPTTLGAAVSALGNGREPLEGDTVASEIERRARFKHPISPFPIFASSKSSSRPPDPGQDPPPPALSALSSGDWR